MSIRDSVKLLEEVGLADNKTSDAQPLQEPGYCIQARWVETAANLVGTIKLQASVNNLTWSDIADSEQAISGSGSYIWNMTDQYYAYVRVVYTRTSGTCALSAWFLSKYN